MHKNDSNELEKRKQALKLIKSWIKENKRLDKINVRISLKKIITNLNKYYKSYSHI